MQWLTSRNQFFVTLLESKKAPFLGYRAEEVDLPRFEPQQSQIPKGAQIWGLMQGFNLSSAGEKICLSIFIPVPREYQRLTKLGGQKQLVMDFGLWSWVSVTLLNTMNFLHRFVHNYGVAIILMVLLIKGIFWPLQAKANRTMKQMQVLGPKLKELQEKYKDQPQKAQIEMMQIYRTYGINPMGGCLPMLVQIPVFFGFYAMLRSAVELRDAHFLWIQDLSQPDTVAHLLGFPVNPLPLVMGATSFWQTSIMPNTSMDKGQATIMKLMPLMFVVFCYNYASALALYWTIQNLVSVYQTYHNLAKPSPELKKTHRPKSRWQAMMEMARQQAEMKKNRLKK
ncbi:MAG: membrane protein insertase YidC [Verrucomicrobiia bacterium]